MPMSGLDLTVPEDWGTDFGFDSVLVSILDRLGYGFPPLRRLLHPQSLTLIQNGTVVESTPRKEFLTRDDVRAQLRQEGVGRPEEVRWALVESDGRVSVLPWEHESHPRTRERQAS